MEEKTNISMEAIVKSWPILVGLLNNHRFNAPTTMKFNRLVKIIEPERKEFEKQRVELCERNGTKNEKTEEYDIAPEHKEVFDSEFKELISQNVSIPNDLKISIQNFKTPLSLKEAMELKATSIDIPIGVLELELLSWLITD